MSFKLVSVTLVLCLTHCYAFNICKTKLCECEAFAIRCSCTKTNSSTFLENDDAGEREVDLSGLLPQFDHLTVSDCPGVHLKTNFFKKTKIRTVFFENSNVDVDTYAFAKAPHLRSIHFAKSDVKLTKGSFSDLKVDKVAFRFVRIGTVEPLAFKGLNTKSIIFDNCTIGQIQGSAFYGAEINRLSITNTFINTIHPNALWIDKIANLEISKSEINLLNGNGISFDVNSYHEANIKLLANKFHEIRGSLIEIYQLLGISRLVNFTFEDNVVINGSMPYMLMDGLSKTHIKNVRIADNSFQQIHFDSDSRDFKYDNIHRSRFCCDRHLCATLRHSFPLNEESQWNNFDRLMFRGAQCVNKRFKDDNVFDIYSQFSNYEECNQNLYKNTTRSHFPKMYIITNQPPLPKIKCVDDKYYE